MKFKSLLLLTLLFTLLSSCKKKATETDNLFKYRDYISYTTSNIISVYDPIRVNLAHDVEGWELDKDLSQDIIKIKPHVSGRVVASNKHAFTFIPDQPLKPDTEYAITVKLGDLYKEIPSDFKDYTFQFKTIKPNFNVTTKNLQSYNKEWQFL